MKRKICLTAILLFLCSMQIVLAQEKTQSEQKKVIVCSDCGFVLNNNPIFLPEPEYSKAALMVNASGAVQVQITIDENGNVESAKAVSGHPLLWAESVKSALKSKWKPIELSGKPIKVTGVIVYNFSLDKSTLPQRTEEQKQIVLPRGKPIIDLADRTEIGKAIKLPKPSVPSVFGGKLNKVEKVFVEALINEDGNVISAKAFTGHLVLRFISEGAARGSKFSQTKVSGKTVKANVSLVYIFTIAKSGQAKVFVNYVKAKK